jgi:hypothetical protein
MVPPSFNKGIIITKACPHHQTDAASESSLPPVFDNTFSFAASA